MESRHTEADMDHNTLLIVNLVLTVVILLLGVGPFLRR
jgi:hypothetical protein